MSISPAPRPLYRPDPKARRRVLAERRAQARATPPSPPSRLATWWSARTLVRRLGTILVWALGLAPVAGLIALAEYAPDRLLPVGGAIAALVFALLFLRGLKAGMGDYSGRG